MHWLLIVGVAAFFAGALDPLANWATFASFDPRVPHFPLSWPYFNISPLLEPTLPFLGGYASYRSPGSACSRSIDGSSNRTSVTTAGSTGIGSSPSSSPDSLRTVGGVRS